MKEREIEREGEEKEREIEREGVGEEKERGREYLQQQVAVFPLEWNGRCAEVLAGMTRI